MDPPPYSEAPAKDCWIRWRCCRRRRYTDEGAYCPHDKLLWAFFAAALILLIVTIGVLWSIVGGSIMKRYSPPLVVTINYAGKPHAGHVLLDMMKICYSPAESTVLDDCRDSFGWSGWWHANLAKMASPVPTYLRPQTKMALGRLQVISRTVYIALGAYIVLLIMHLVLCLGLVWNWSGERDEASQLSVKHWWQIWRLILCDDRPERPGVVCCRPWHRFKLWWQDYLYNVVPLFNIVGLICLSVAAHEVSKLNSDTLKKINDKPGYDASVQGGYLVPFLLLIVPAVLVAYTMAQTHRQYDILVLNIHGVSLSQLCHRRQKISISEKPMF